jgi:hypothetical protein
VGVARRNATVRVGATSAGAREVGVLVASARVRLDPETRTANSIAFMLAGDEIAPPRGERLWIATADIDEIRHAPRPAGD